MLHCARHPHAHTCRSSSPPPARAYPQVEQRALFVVVLQKTSMQLLKLFATVDALKELKKWLKSHHQGGGVELLKQVLVLLKRLPVTLQVLKDSKIGAAVKPLSSETQPKFPDAGACARHHILRMCAAVHAHITRLCPPAGLHAALTRALTACTEVVALADAIMRRWRKLVPSRTAATATATTVRACVCMGGAPALTTLRSCR